jgi:hypothetical protein
VFYSYEISPLVVMHREERQSLAHFLTSTLAVIGGVLTVAGLVDSFVVRTLCSLTLRCWD